MRFRSFRHGRHAAGFVSLSVIALALVGCTKSPPGHEDRLDKAAGVASFEIVCTRDVWDRTRVSGRDKLNDTKFDNVRPVAFSKDRTDLIKVTLSGPELVDYLRKLDYDAHGGFQGEEADAPVARRMYNALAPVVDKIKRGQAPEKTPRAVLDDATAAAGPEPSESKAAKD